MPRSLAVLQRVVLLSSLLAAALSGCGPSHTLRLPPGVTCAQTVGVGPTGNELPQALARATAGTCVVAAPGKYAVALTVPAGVTLAADVGTVVEVAGDTASPVALTLGTGATLSGIQVNSRSGIGVSITGGGTQLLDVGVRGAPQVGVVAWCEEDCLVADVSMLGNLELIDNGVGLLVHGARVSLQGGRISGSQSTALNSGYGLVASHGAVLEMTDTVVETSQELGVLIDGALGTTATLGKVTVRDNRGRGVWVQALEGTALAPKLRMNDCVVEGNRLVGVGARASRGISVQGGRVAATAIGMADGVKPGTQVQVGDGVGLFVGSGDVVVDGVTLANNVRSQVLVDEGSMGLKIQGGAITAAAGQLGVVVQNTTAVVEAPMIVTPPSGSELAISAPAFGVPVR